jgi:hypothetical protein
MTRSSSEPRGAVDESTYRPPFGMDVYEGFFGLDFIRDIRAHIARWLAGNVDESLGLDDDGELPKVDNANRIQEFRLDTKFQETFDTWVAEVEQREKGTLTRASRPSSRGRRAC